MDGKRSEMLQRILVVLLVACLWIGIAEARQIGQYKSLTASVPDNFECSEKVELIITAPDESYFKGDTVALQRLVGAARAALGFECEKIQSILISGQVGSRQVYRGISAASDNWVVAALAEAAPQSISAAALTGAWRGTFNGQKIELVLWPRKDQADRVEGYLYLFRHDCLMGASGLFSENRFEIYFGKGLAKDREYNCMLNIEGFNGPDQFTFSGDGFVVGMSPDSVTYDLKELILGERLVDKNSASKADQKQIVFKKMPLSPEMFEILQNYENPDLGKPDARTLAEMTKGSNGAPPTTEQKKQVTRKSNKTFSSPYHDEKFLTRWNSDLYDGKNAIYRRSTVDAARRADGKLVLKVRSADSSNYVVDLVEDKLYADGYLVTLSVDAGASCAGRGITRGYLHPYSSKERKWPYLEMYNDEGEVVVAGTLDGIKGGLPGLHPDLSQSFEKKIKSLEKEIMPVKLQAIKPQTLYTQCRIFEYQQDYVRETEWCLCLDEQYRDVLSGQEYADAVKDYKSFYKLSCKDPSQSGDWRYNNAVNYCRECRENKYRDGCLQRDNKSPNERNYKRILNSLLKGDYASIENDILFKHFFVDYIQAYSDWCGAKYIEKGQYRKRTEKTIDSETGFEVGPTEVHEIYIDYRYVDIFDRYLGEVEADIAKGLLSKKLLSDPMKMIQFAKQMLSDTIASRLVLNNHMGNKCPAKEVEIVYGGLLKIH